MKHAIYAGETVWDALVTNLELNHVEEDEFGEFCRAARPNFTEEIQQYPLNKDQYIELLHLHRDWEAGR